MRSAGLLALCLVSPLARGQGLDAREPALWRRAASKDQAALEALALKAEGDTDVHLLGRLALQLPYKPMVRSGASALLARMKAGFDPLATPDSAGADLMLLESLAPTALPARASLSRLLERIENLAPEVGAPMLQQAQALGSKEARGAFGLRLLQGRGVKKDPDAGFAMVMASDSTRAAVLAGELMEAQDPARAAKAYLSARKTEDPSLAFRVGRGLEQAGRRLGDSGLDLKAKDAYLRAAEGQHGGAAGALARFESEGRGGGEASPAKVRAWAEKAVAWGAPEGHFWLGKLDDLGGDRPRDVASALRHFKAGAEGGDPACMHRLGLAHQRGEGVPMDASQASHWFAKAADLGHGPSAFALAQMMLAEGRAAEARARLAVAAEGGLPSAQEALADLLLRGEGGPEDWPAARLWLSKAASQGSGEAHFRLALLDLDSVRTKADAEAVIEHLRQAAREGHAEGQAVLNRWRP